MSEEETQAQGQPSIGIYPAPNGLVLEIDDGSGNDPQRLVLDPDDASKIAVNLITNIVLFSLNHSMRMAVERAEADKLRSMILGNKEVTIDDILKKK